MGGMTMGSQINFLHALCCCPGSHHTTVSQEVCSSHHIPRRPKPGIDHMEVFLNLFEAHQTH